MDAGSDGPAVGSASSPISYASERAAWPGPHNKPATIQRFWSASGDLWARLTVAECALHEYLLDGGEDKLGEATAAYPRAAARVEPQQLRSARRQLELMRAAGDPPKVIDPLLALFER